MVAGVGPAAAQIDYRDICRALVAAVHETTAERGALRPTGPTGGCFPEPLTCLAIARRVERR